MRKLFVVAMLATMLLSIAAIAQPIDPDPDQFGIYFDLNATNNFDPSIAAGGSINIYLMVTNPSAPQIMAWECKVVWDQMGGGFFGSWAFANNGINVGDVSNPANLLFAVGTGANPIVTTPATLLATWSGYYAYGTGSTFTIQPYPGTASFDPPAPGYAIDEVNLQPCGVTSGSFDAPCAAFGAAAEPVANQDMSWSNVKSLFR